MTVTKLEKQVLDHKRWIDLTETRLAQGVVRLEKFDARFNMTDAKIDTLPRVIAELITKRG